VNRLLGRTALGVEGLAAGLDRHPGVQPGGPGDVARLLSGLGDAAARDLLYRGRIETGPLDQRRLRPAEYLRRMQARERTAALAYRRPHGLDYHRSTHTSSFTARISKTARLHSRTCS
jgi:hypothetical protein